MEAQVGLADVTDVQVMLGGCTSNVGIRIDNFFKATMDFTLQSSPYTFTLTTWMRRGMGPFLQLFHAHTARDSATFGTVVVDDDGNTAIAVVMPQKINAIRQACVDVLKCLDQILTVHKRAVLDYADWYREHYMVPTTYADYVTLLTCHSIVHSDFLAPGITWQVVTFA
jgi:hypothetical protein